jgi:hypothetical protein
LDKLFFADGAFYDFNKKFFFAQFDNRYKNAEFYADSKTVKKTLKKKSFSQKNGLQKLPPVIFFWDYFLRFSD